MDFLSTRSESLRTTAAGAILGGLAPDGGLYLPESIPAFSLSEIGEMAELSYPALAGRVLERFLPGFTLEELLSYAHKAYASFDTPAVTPLHTLKDDLFTLELYHGPTAAFKDLALQILPYLLAASVKKCGDDHTVAILVATSGDTGKAALAGFADVPGTRIGVFYPHGGVSDIQRAQMVTQEWDNVLVLAVEGNFDDAQTAVKAIFSDKALSRELEEGGVILSSANSINWGRLAPQIAYYYAAYASLLRQGRLRLGEAADFAVPTGNFGDILAGYLAKKSGLPVGRLICASNSNNVLTDFLTTGVYDRNRPFYKTMSPSMDILVSSNLERLLYLVTRDSGRVKGWMESLRREGRYEVGEEVLSALRSEGFAAGCADEAATAAAIRRTWEREGYLADPHTAVGLSVARELRDGERPCVVLSTASPYKFASDMLASLGQRVPESGFDAQDALAAFSATAIPAGLGSLREKPERFPGVVRPDAMSAAVKDWLMR